MIRYGFQRLALLNSAGYSRAELPLDDSVSLNAPNNIGKTSLINALQFILIIDKRFMDFSPKDFEESRRYYFPDNSSYILLEAALPTSGTVVLGCVGRGVSHDYQYFAYKGELNLEDFRTEQGGIVQQPNFAEHMANRGKLVSNYSSGEFADIVYGRSKRRFHEGEVDFRVFRLEDPRTASVYQRVLTRTLRLDRLSAREVKDYLLAIFHNDMSDAGIDFKAEWDKAFSGINADKAQYEAAKRHIAVIEDIREQHVRRQELRGKIIHFRPKIDATLDQWAEYYRTSKERHEENVGKIEKQQEAILPTTIKLTTRKSQLNTALESLNASASRQEKLEQEFTLIQGRGVIEQRLNADRTALEKQITLLQNSSSRSLSAIERDINETSRSKDQLERELGTLKDNLYLRLKSSLSETQLDALNRLLSQQVMTLGAGEFTLDADALMHALSMMDSEHLYLPGLTVSLSALLPQHTQRTHEEIQERIKELSDKVIDLKAQKTVAENLEKERQKKTHLESAVRAAEGEIKRYDELQGLRESRASREDEMRKIQEEQGTITHSLAEMQNKSTELGQKIQQIREELHNLHQQNAEILRLRENRGDNDPEFDHLADLPHTPWLGRDDIRLEALAESLERYKSDCYTLRQLSTQLDRLINLLHTGGLTKFQYAGSAEDEIVRVLDFADNLTNEARALELHIKEAVTNVTVCLRELRSSLNSFSSKMNEFNRLLGRMQISDLDVFRITPVIEDHLSNAINTLIASAEQASIGETFDMLNHGSVLDDASLNKAKEILIKEGEAHGCLKLEHFFRLEFTVRKKGAQAVSFSELDSSASTGTTIITKLVTGLALLYMMKDKRHNVYAACYLDESATLDHPNILNLIHAANDFGFALVMAAPEPAMAARYCVPILRSNGRNSISRKDWEILDPATGKRSKGLGEVSEIEAAV